MPANGDEILTTELVRLLAGTRGAFEFETRGEMELKGLDVPVTAYAVAWVPEALQSVTLPARLETLDETLLVGRTAELALLSDALKQADETTRRRVALLSGEAGIGKTTLVSTFARAARESGAVVLYGRCDEDLAVPYQPWMEALGHLVACAPDSLLAAHVKERGGDLGALVPGLAARVGELPASRSSDPETERHLLFGAVVDLLERVGVDAPIVLILDDLHWSDRPTLQLLRYVTGADAPLRVLVLGTFRDGDIGAGHPLTDLLAVLHREEGVERIALRGLDDDELLSLMEAVAGHEMDQAGIALRDDLRTETNGNPFFAMEILRHLAETGVIAQGDDGRWTAVADLRTHGLPVSVREVVGRRIERLSPEATRVLSAAAIIGRDFDIDLLAEVTETREDDLLDLLDLAEQAAVVTEAPGGGDRYTFVHALIQHTLYDDLSAARRRRLHRNVAEALEAMVSAPGERVTELARHWYEATQPSDVRKAYQYSLEAGDQALERLAPDEAIRWFNQALELVAMLGPESVVGRCDSLIRLGEAQRQAGNPAFRETLLEATALAQELDDSERLVSAALKNTRGFWSGSGEVDLERMAAITAALDVVGTADPALRSRLLAQLSTESTYATDVSNDELLEESLRLAREANDDAALMTAFHAFHDHWVPHNLDRRLDLAEYEALSVRADPAWRGWFAADAVFGAIQSGDIPAARRHVPEIERVGREVGVPTLQWLGAMFSGALVQSDGDLERADQMAEVALQVGLDTGQPDAFEAYAGQLVATRLAQGRIGEIVDLVAETVDENPGIPTFRAALAECLCDLDRMDEARVILDDFASTGLESLPVDPLWIATLTYLAYASAAADHRESAAQVESLLRPFRDQIVFTAVSIVGPVATALGAVQAVLEQWDDAEALFTDALAVSERLGWKYWVAVTQYNWGRMLRAKGGERERADELLQSARDTAAQHGFGSLEARAARLLAS